jgi:hypothetical protein
MSDDKQDNEPLFFVNGKQVRFVRGRDEIESSEDPAVKAIFAEAWELIRAVRQELEAGSLEDKDGIYNKGIYRLEHRGADFNLDAKRKQRLSFVVFNAYPTIVLNPAVEAGDPAEALATMRELVRLIGEHDQNFWNQMARVMID